VDALDLSTICAPCKNGSTKGLGPAVHRSHTPYDYNEVLND
jgi:hypothetical protein